MSRGNGAPTPEPGGIMRMRFNVDEKRISINPCPLLKPLPAADSKRMGKKSINVEITAWCWQSGVMYGIMAVKVRISYEKPQELHTVLKLLNPVIKSCKTDKGVNGRYKRAYLEVNISEENAQKSVNSPLI